MLAKRLTPLLLLLSLAACEQASTLLDLPDPRKEAAMAEADGKAIGGACRHAGRSLEDCYALNAKAQKAFVFAGWREMNDYMMQNNMQSVPSQIPMPQGMSISPQASTVKDPEPPAELTPIREERPSRRSRPSS
jgi:hypothetical protein